DEGHVVVHQAFDPGNRRHLVHEVRKAHFDDAAVAVQALHHFGQHGLEGFHGDFLFTAVQDFHEPAHVRSLVAVRQEHVHVEGGHRMLLAAAAVGHTYRVLDVLNADLVDVDAARVVVALDVGDG